MRDSKQSVKFMQVLDRTIFLRLKDLSRRRGVTVQELIRVLVIPDWMRRFEDESRRVGSLRRHRRTRVARGTSGLAITRVRAGPKRETPA
ncbi:MAG TPA: hypothetical protein VF906_04220 [Candidatus Bathyarchaeia archaeon]